MPVICDLPIKLTMGEVLRWQGFKKSIQVKPGTKNLIRDLICIIKKDNIMAPAVAYEIYPIADIRKDQMFLGVHKALQGCLLTFMLQEAKELAAVVCTIGSRLEKKATEYFHKNEPLRGMLIDGIGSAAINSLSRKVCELIMDEASSRGWQASSAFRPCTPGCAISSRRHLFELVPAEKIGVRLTVSGMMVPRMSISMFIGIGHDMISWTQTEICARCSMKKNCLYRVSR